MMWAVVILLLLIFGATVIIAINTEPAEHRAARLEREREYQEWKKNRRSFWSVWVAAGVLGLLIWGLMA